MFADTVHYERANYWTPIFCPEFAYSLTGATLTTWAHAWSQSVTYPTCAFWFYLFLIVVTVVALVVFGIVAKWYKKRERDDLVHEQKIVEDYYIKYIH